MYSNNRSRYIWGGMALMISVLLIGIGFTMNRNKAEAASSVRAALRARITAAHGQIQRQRKEIARTDALLAGANNPQRRQALSTKLRQQTVRLIKLDVRALDADRDLAQEEYRVKPTAVNKRHLHTARLAVNQISQRMTALMAAAE
ncbi:hypothetical protein [Lacticaseibacillus sharpeae]|nr:hypothetical protein [Lacticaseibacillus sharpeae]